MRRAGSSWIVCSFPILIRFHMLIFLLYVRLIFIYIRIPRSRSYFYIYLFIIIMYVIYGLGRKTVVKHKDVCRKAHAAQYRWWLLLCLSNTHTTCRNNVFQLVIDVRRDLHDLIAQILVLVGARGNGSCLVGLMGAHRVQLKRKTFLFLRPKNFLSLVRVCLLPHIHPIMEYF